MSRIQYDPILPGDLIASAPIDAVFSAIATASAAIDVDNHAEEGLDHRVFVDNCGARRLAVITETTRASIAATGGTPTQYVQNGTAFRTSSSLHTLAGSQALRIFSWVHFTTTLAGGLGIDVGSNFGIEHYYDTGGGGAFATVNSFHGWYCKAAPAGTFYQHGTLVSESWLFAGGTVVNWVELRYLLTGGAPGLRAQNAGLIVDLFDRVTVTEV